MGWRRLKKLQDKTVFNIKFIWMDGDMSIQGGK